MLETTDRRSVFGTRRDRVLDPIEVPEGVRLDAPNRMDGLDLLGLLDASCVPVVFFDPQHRGVLDYQSYGNEGVTRGRRRSSLPQMSAAEIASFVREIDRVLVPTGHLFLWLDKFHLCNGIGDWTGGTALATVDLVTWNKGRMGMGYRTRRMSEYLLVLQKAPKRAKGVWTLHDIPDIWAERVQGRRFAHRKPTALQARLIEAVTERGDVVVDPAAGSYSVLDACRAAGRNFLGCDIAPAAELGNGGEAASG